jgi:hypothetical protein
VIDEYRRARIVAAIHAGGLSYRELASLFGMTAAHGSRP